MKLTRHDDGLWPGPYFTDESGYYVSPEFYPDEIRAAEQEYQAAQRPPEGVLNIFILDIPGGGL